MEVLSMRKMLSSVIVIALLTFIYASCAQKREQIEVGTRADLVLVNDNPLADMGNIRGFRGVMEAGRWYSKESLDRMIANED